MPWSLAGLPEERHRARFGDVVFLEFLANGAWYIYEQRNALNLGQNVSANGTQGFCHVTALEATASCVRTDTAKLVLLLPWAGRLQAMHDASSSLGAGEVLSIVLQTSQVYPHAQLTYMKKASIHQRFSDYPSFDVESITIARTGSA